MKIQCSRPLILFLWILFLFIFFLGYSHASRTTNVFNINVPKSQQYKGHFFNFLPRHLPIPTSGPSRRHNDIGLQNRKSP
ncbi:hypothetical protein MANES_12G152100v8 [Manihot esculenta]|uniref:Uncharacterized protein n=1 Tax=Manihot esculenta TaxID=3983 RepID=A0A2C9UWU8_MANES|nr:hypothetical protein MANES_12G152100v8 [Manihot esculenta]